MSRQVHLEESVQVLVGCCRVADMKLDRLAHPDQVGDGQSAAGLIDSEHVADQEITALEFVLILVDDAADVEAVLKELLVFRFQLLP